MKKIVRLAFLLFLLSGTFASTVLADGGGTTPICDPTTQNCTTTITALTSGTSVLP